MNDSTSLAASTVLPALLLLGLSGCSDDPKEAEESATGETATTSGTITTSGSSESGEVGSETDSGPDTGDGDGDTNTGDGDGDTGPPPDCDNLAPLPLSFVEIPGAKSAEDYIFNPDGKLLSINNNSLFSASYGEDADFLFPGVATGFTSGTSMLPGGDLIFNDVASGSVRRVDSEGGTTVVVGGLAYPNGLTVDNEGWIYVAEDDGARVVRFQADNAQTEVVVQTDGPNGLAFSADFRRLYIGSFDHGGVKEYDLDTEELTVINSELSAIDGVVTDICDNVYVTQFGSGQVWRIDPEHQAELVVELPSGWIPNLNFGSGVGGWELDRIYVSDMGGDRVFELQPGTVGIDPPHL
jgi:sugar lactone lactonase YvrE